MPPVYDFVCSDCSSTLTESRPYEERDNQTSCSSCYSIMVRTWLKMPSVTRASYIDSKKTTRGEAADKLIRASHLQTDLESMDPKTEKYKETKQEINRLKKTELKDRKL